jgi:hypothetical protein
LILRRKNGMREGVMDAIGKACSGAVMPASFGHIRSAAQSAYTFAPTTMGRRKK